MTKKLQILAVDDEPMVAEGIGCALEAPHREVAVAANGEVALAMAAKKNFDVIITDHRMPRAGGVDVVRQLRKRKYTGKIVVLSGHLSPENKGAYKELAVDKIVGKPCASTKLRNTIASLEARI